MVFHAAYYKSKCTVYHLDRCPGGSDTVRKGRILRVSETWAKAPPRTVLHKGRTVMSGGGSFAHFPPLKKRNQVWRSRCNGKIRPEEKEVLLCTNPRQPNICIRLIRACSPQGADKDSGLATESMEKNNQFRIHQPVD